MNNPAPAEIPLCTPDLGPEERRLLLEALDSTFVSSVGPFVERFEHAFAATVGSPHAVACSCGTAAIHLALRVAGVQAGDTVLVSDFTFIASATPIVHLGAHPVFVDSEERTWNLDPQALADAIADLERAGRKPKALVAVHILGMPADLGPVVDLCERHGITLIEDAAEALGAGYDEFYAHAACAGKQVGTIGRIGCFSFNGNKIITTGGGGMCVTADPALARRMKHLSTQAKLPGLAFVHDEVGYNYRLTNLAAALGLAQLERLPQLIARKHAIADRYRAALSDLGCAFQPALSGIGPSDWLTSCLVPGDRDAVLARLTAAGIGSRPLWRPLSDQPAFAGSRSFGRGVGRRLAATGLNLPCSTHLGASDQQRVIDALTAALTAATAGAPDRNRI
jgi:dTDP-4-amino-4,6-dideoxygalactose transaminase